MAHSAAHHGVKKDKQEKGSVVKEVIVILTI